MTGNGTFNVSAQHHDYGMAFLKISSDLTTVTPFAPTSANPFDARWFLNFVDADLGSSGQR